MKKLKVGMISFAHGHAYSYLNSLRAMSNVEIVGIADEIKGRVEEVTTNYGLPYYENYQDLLARDFDAVVICSENARHAEITIAAAKSGKHVLCEKPLGISVSEMEAMISACKENGVQLMTAFPCRYLASVIKAKEAVEHGEIGDIIAIKGTNRGSLPSGWFLQSELSGGGALLDHTVHVMDLMNWITQSEVKEVYAYSATLFNENLDIDDTGMIHVKFESGVFGVLDTSWSRNSAFPTWGDVTMTIIGTKGTLSLDGFAQKNELYSLENGKGVWNFWGDSMDDYLVKDFVHALLNGEQVPITGEDGLRSTVVALAGYKSVELGQPVLL
ncbi:Gfo/Idh/MocA family oxidoreductase [Paenibacillus alginolyticus]|jgi:predicted dehydrogenase|uniref:Gfo/Idh/MocA family oxidoreductase n=1 Tax=Paenibacillus alginolyticus TaxID=59839 RepID=A0ABT4GHI8_9BACL|nr:Gfo/Idh/MocA family oxidoreductase [Paenibacillus alginolyticus]MCY9663964.1 Gfo/Idh/MocA family oxidoreductase [Paenibacillus alginolyticus]MCY9695675.1 Gfo/Idh/MocA family oxidoreductase [Paenibacillus alginolyticus]MEC0142213.1 Gfo/Idh/MocA family oxidoreductase [Paenibacillus alginolyticus]